MGLRRRKFVPDVRGQGKLNFLEDAQRASAHVGSEEQRVEKRVLFVVWGDRKESVVRSAADRIVGTVPGVRLSVIPFSDAQSVVNAARLIRSEAGMRVLILVDTDHLTSDPETVVELRKLTDIRMRIEVVVFSREKDWGRRVPTVRTVLDKFKSVLSLEKAAVRPFFVVRRKLLDLVSGS